MREGALIGKPATRNGGAGGVVRPHPGQSAHAVPPHRQRRGIGHPVLGRATDRPRLAARARSRGPGAERLYVLPVVVVPVGRSSSAPLTR
ncbi:hypothetical protein [Streptomyces niphimycinicus]|uniref:hypothetical protein n=1 Tax=Streptomyces niphimycinicus TaxID=2842201 RepID=UPI0035579773